jgi:hypothetical protein
LFPVELTLIKPSRCLCHIQCPIHGEKAVPVVFEKNASMRTAIISLAMEFELKSRIPDTVGEALDAAHRTDWRAKAQQIWRLLGECECRSMNCGHPNLMHEPNGTCTVCASIHSRTAVCWS